MEPTQNPNRAEFSDEDLVAAVVQGDIDAFESLFNRHRKRVAAIAGRFFQQPAQIEEIVQESFIKAYLNLSHFAHYKADSFGAWLARIAFNNCYDELRKQSRKHEHSASEFNDRERQELRALTAAAPALESNAINRDLANKLLRMLSAEDRLVLVLLDVEGLSVAEIARLMNWSAPKVKIRIFRARSDLRRLLKKLL